MQNTNSLNKRENLSRGLISGLIAFIILLGLSASGLLTRLENLSGDVLRKTLAKDFVSPIEIVYLDQSSLSDAEKEFNLPYPWPRESYGKALEFLKYAGAKAVVFDWLFTSHSPMGIEDDKIFAKAIKKHGLVVAGMQVLEKTEGAGIERLKAQEDIYSIPLAASPGLFKGPGIDLPFPPLWGAFKGIGHTNFLQDKDGLGRKTRLLSVLNGKVYPSMSLSAAWNIAGQPALSFDGHSFRMGDRAFNVDSSGEMNILFRKYDPAKKRARLLDLVMSGVALGEGGKPTLDPTRYNFKDKIVFLGSNAAAMVDLRPSPMGEHMPGVEIQAMVLDNLLSGESLTIMPMLWWNWAILFVLCVLIARASFSFRFPAMLLPAAIASIAVLTLVIWSYQEKQTLIPIATPLLGFLLSLGFAAEENYQLERKQKNRVQNIFGQFLSPAVLKKLGTSMDEMKTGGETKNLAVFFSDLAGFTSFSEKLTPDQLVVILNEYLEEMAEVVVGKHEGYVDKYIGDAIMAFWGAPTPHANPSLEATQAAWNCQVRLAEIQAHLATLGLDAGDEGLVMRIGINYGPCVVGLMGSSRKLNYTVMGDTVNTASRLEGANKPYGTRIMLSDSAREQCGDAVITRVLDLLKVKGKSEPTKVHHLIGLKGEPGVLYKPAYVDAYHKALDLYIKGDFKHARAAFEDCLSSEPKDGVARLYLERCEHFIAEPPEWVWDGVYTMKTK